MGKSEQTTVNLTKKASALRQKPPRQKLRKINSTLMQMIGSADSARQLLEHSDSRIMTDFYSDNDMILRWKVNQLPVSDWLKGEVK